MLNNGDEEQLTEWKGHVPNGTDLSARQITLQIKPLLLFRGYCEERYYPAGITEKAATAAMRKRSQAQTITVDTSVIRIELYDNAEIDDDTVTSIAGITHCCYTNSVFQQAINGKYQCISQCGYELMMYADNLGTCPPNTALMVVTVGKKKYSTFIVQ